MFIFTAAATIHRMVKIGNTYSLDNIGDLNLSHEAARINESDTPVVGPGSWGAVQHFAEFPGQPLIDAAFGSPIRADQRNRVSGNQRLNPSALSIDSDSTTMQTLEAHSMLSKLLEAGPS